jgi:hypothetical protein
MTTPTTAANVKKALANSEPSTHGGQEFESLRARQYYQRLSCDLSYQQCRLATDRVRRHVAILLHNSEGRKGHPAERAAELNDDEAALAYACEMPVGHELDQRAVVGEAAYSELVLPAPFGPIRRSYPCFRIGKAKSGSRADADPRPP